MFCFDDKYFDSFLEGYINFLVVEVVVWGYDFFDVFCVVCVYLVVYYGMVVGLLWLGESVDFIMVEDFRYFKVFEIWIKGSCVYCEG